jgi:hypothetical protein
MAALKYEWKTGWLYEKVDPQKVGEELDRIEAKSSGVLETEAVLEYAESRPRSALYKCFEWDDEKAAHLYRKATVYRIVNNLRVKRVSGGKVALYRKRYHLRSAGGYVSKTEIEQDAEAGEELLVQAKAELLSWLERFEELQDLAADAFATAHQAYEKLDVRPLESKLRKRRKAR